MCNNGVVFGWHLLVLPKHNICLLFVGYTIIVYFPRWLLSLIIQKQQQQKQKKRKLAQKDRKATAISKELVTWCNWLQVKNCNSVCNPIITITNHPPVFTNVFFDNNYAEEPLEPLNHSSPKEFFAVFFFFWRLLI